MDEQEVGRKIHEMIKSLFEDFQPFLSEDDEGNSTMSFLDLIKYLDERSGSIDEKVLFEKVEKLRDWVEEQPRGESAGDDIFTSYFVTFVEGILEHERLFRMAPCVVSKEDLLSGKDYFFQWIGPTEYHRALSVFPDDDRLQSKEL